MNPPDPGDASPEAVGRRLAQLRAALGYGDRQQRAFAKFLGIGITSYNTYETGKQRPPINVALKIIRLTGTNLDWLYRGIEDLLPHHIVVKLRDTVAEEQRRSA